MKKTALLLIALTALGCAKSQSPENEGSKAGSTGDITIPQSLIGNSEADPSEVLVEVNGKQLTHGEAIRQVDLRLGGPPPADMPAGRIAKVRNLAMSQVVDQFVKRTLLLEEAMNLGIAATPKEIEAAVAAIKAKTPEGATAKGVVGDGPGGKDSLRNEVATGIIIEKLLAQVLPPAAAPTDEEVDSFIEDNRSSLVDPKGTPLPRERVIKMLTDRKRNATILAYARVLMDAAEVKHSASIRILE